MISGTPDVSSNQTDHRPTSSAFSRGGSEVHIVPMSVIRRPLPSELDEAKVLGFTDDMQVRHTKDLSILKASEGEHLHSD